MFCFSLVFCFIIIFVRGEFDNLCNDENRSIKKYLFAVEFNETLYIQCSDNEGEYFLRKCAPGTIFSEDEQICVFSKFKLLKSTKNSTEESAKLSTITNSLPLSNQTSTNKASISLKIESTTESLLKRINSTQESQGFLSTNGNSASQASTMQPSNLNTQTLMTKESTTRMNNEASNYNQIGDFCNAKHFNLRKFTFPYPDDSSRYIVCGNIPGIYFVASCPVGQLYNHNIGRCDSVKQKHNMATFIVEDTKTKFTHYDFKSQKFQDLDGLICNEKEMEHGIFLFPDETSKTKFYHCDEFASYEIKECPNGLIFDAKNRVCSFIKNMNLV